MEYKIKYKEKWYQCWYIIPQGFYSRNTANKLCKEIRELGWHAKVVVQ